MVQGGQNLISAYVKVEDDTIQPDWGVTSAIAYSIVSPAESGMGDEQTVVSHFKLYESEYSFVVPLDNATRSLPTIFWTSRR